MFGSYLQGAIGLVVGIAGSVVGGKVKMKELTGTNTTGVKRNRTTKSSPITSSILNWWKQKGIDTQSQSNKNFMKAQKTLPKNFGRGSY